VMLAMSFFGLEGSSSELPSKRPWFTCTCAPFSAGNEGQQDQYDWD